MTPADRTPQPLELHQPGIFRGQRAPAPGRAGRVLALEREVERLNAHVLQLEREKDDVEAFAAVAAHELVGPLVMTEAYASILTDRLDEPEHAASRAELQALGRSVARLRLLTESVLHEARSSGHPINRRRIDVAALVADCLRLLDPEIVARQAVVTVDDLPDVLADEALLSGVFCNLLINALKYCPRVGASIRIGGMAGSQVARYHVDSEGPPIPVEDRTRIFGRYQRGRGERRVAGTGLGLNICQRIIMRHGGEIGVEPINGNGNRFYFTLPLSG
jgi:signal transduction histidine kinase